MESIEDDRDVERDYMLNHVEEDDCQNSNIDNVHILHDRPLHTMTPHIFSRNNWSLEEMLILLEAKLEESRNHDVQMSKPLQRRAKERWLWIENYCWSHRVRRSAGQCHDKWEGIITSFNKVNNYEKLDDTECESYWTMSTSKRKLKNLPPALSRDLYDALVKDLHQNRVIGPCYQPKDLIVATSTPSPPQASSDKEGEKKEKDEGVRSISHKRKFHGGAHEKPLLYKKEVVDEFMSRIMYVQDEKNKRHRQKMELKIRIQEFEEEKFLKEMALKVRKLQLKEEKLQNSALLAKCSDLRT